MKMSKCYLVTISSRELKEAPGEKSGVKLCFICGILSHVKSILLFPWKSLGIAPLISATQQA